MHRIRIRPRSIWLRRQRITGPTSCCSSHTPVQSWQELSTFHRLVPMASIQRHCYVHKEEHARVNGYRATQPAPPSRETGANRHTPPFEPSQAFSQSWRGGEVVENVGRIQISPTRPHGERKGKKRDICENPFSMPTLRETIPNDDPADYDSGDDVYHPYAHAYEYF